MLNTISVENHKFSAQVVTEGRAKLHHSVVDVKPWELHINGQKLAVLDAKEIAAVTQMQPETCEGNFLKVMAQHTYHIGFQKSIAGESQSAVDYLVLSDWQKVKDSNKTWRYAQMLAGNDELQTMHVFFLISGLVIDAACQGKNQPGPDVFFYTCNDGIVYHGDQELFMSNKAGDTILALDPPFKLTFFP